MPGFFIFMSDCMGRIDNTRVILEELKMEKNNPAAPRRIEELISTLEKAQQMKTDNDNKPLPPPEKGEFYIKFKNHLTLAQYLEIAKEVCPIYKQRFEKVGYFERTSVCGNCKGCNHDEEKEWCGSGADSKYAGRLILC